MRYIVAAENLLRFLFMHAGSALSVQDAVRVSRRLRRRSLRAMDYALGLYGRTMSDAAREMFFRTLRREIEDVA